MINPVRDSQWVKTNQILDAKRDKTTSSTQTATESTTDVVEIGSNSQASVVYSKADAKKADLVDIEALQQQVDNATENLRNIVQKLILQQGQKTTSATSMYNDAVEQANLAISEEGDYGVEAVSDRIVDFAIAVAGDDKTKLEELKAAIDKGFSEAGKTIGGELPDICNQTYNAIMEKLDNWSQEA